MNTIPILFEQESQQSESGTLGVLTPTTERVIKEIDADKIKQSLSELSSKLSDMFQDIKAVGNFQLKTVQLSVEISAEGGVSLIANAKAGASGTVTLTFSEK